MRSRMLVIVRITALIAAAFALFVMGLRQGKANQPHSQRQPARGSRAPLAQKENINSTVGMELTAPNQDGPIIQVTELISIPFFSASMPLRFGGSSALAVGGVTCTAGQDVTIAITLTQSLSGASATGQWDGACTGVEQLWKEPVAVASGPVFVAGDAQACGFAETRDDGVVTETETWCDDVTLAWNHYLPVIHKP